jgi:toxin ParE1/3/4
VTIRKLGSARPDIAEDARALVIDHWIAFYRLIDNDVQIVRVVDGVQDLTKLEWIEDSDAPAA